MKTLYTTILATLILSAGAINIDAAKAAGSGMYYTAPDNDSTETYELLEKSLLFGLQTEYNAVLESVLFNAIVYKTRYPEFSSDKVEQSLLQVINENSTHMVRYKAYLVLSFYRNYEAFDSGDDLVSLIETDKPNDVFFYIDEKIRDNQLTVR